MFGYVLPRRDKLSPGATERYRAGYCGLCRALKLGYGFAARFLVNYDMTFLYFLLSREDAPARPCFCPARPFCRKNCLDGDPVMEYAADLTVLLSWWKLRDAQRDGNLFHRLGAGGGLALYRRAYRRAALRQPEADAAFSRQLERLSTLEEQNCSSIDRPADAFGTLLRGCAACVKEEKHRRVLEMLLYHVGRFLYLTDALEDLPRDLRRGSYNPLIFRYRLDGDHLLREDQESLEDTLQASVSLAASALELLPRSVNFEIVENIIYYGLPAVLDAVAAGTFRKPAKRRTG